MDKNAAATLLARAKQWPDRQWAVEGATGLGRGIAQQVVTAGETVLDVTGQTHRTSKAPGI